MFGVQHGLLQHYKSLVICSCSCRYMGTIVGINDCDPLRWPNSKWRNLQVTCPSTFIHETISIKKHKIIGLSGTLNILCLMIRQNGMNMVTGKDQIGLVFGKLKLLKVFLFFLPQNDNVFLDLLVSFVGSFLKEAFKLFLIIFSISGVLMCYKFDLVQLEIFTVPGTWFPIHIVCVYVYITSCQC